MTVPLFIVTFTWSAWAVKNPHIIIATRAKINFFILSLFVVNKTCKYTTNLPNPQIFEQKTTILGNETGIINANHAKQ